MGWEFGKSTKKCAACDRAFGSGEEYFSALFWKATTDYTETVKENFIRKDYCIPCWEKKPSDAAGKTTGKPDKDASSNVFSFWKTRITVKEVVKTPREVLVEFFDNLIEPSFQPKPDAPIPAEIRQKVIYLFALVLLRKKVLRIKENVSREGQPFIIFERTPDGKVYEVLDLTISENELVSLRNEFSKLFEFEI